jgi:hypothetical protein
VRVWLSIALLSACSRIESTGPVTAEQLAEACVKYSACGPPTVPGCLFDATTAEGLVSVYRRSELRCLVDASADCAEVLACVDNSCPNGQCAIGTCTPPVDPVCNGTHIETCNGGGTLTSFDCAVYDETCKLFPFGGVACAEAAGVPCVESYCNGDVLVQCTGEERHVSCGSLFSGGRCFSRQNRCGYADECSPFDPVTCIGDSVHVCVLGKLVDVSCTQLGFARCSNGACFAN